MSTKIIVIFMTYCNVILSDTEITIFHTNDVHSRYDERGARGGAACEVKEDGTKAKCYGGMARHKTYLDETRPNVSNPLLLSAGDWFSGTIYFSKFEGKMMRYYLEALGYDAVGLGNHEFDKGPEVLRKAIVGITNVEILSANIDTEKQPDYTDVIKPFIKKKVKDSNDADVDIGIIGYTIRATEYLSSPGPNITFKDEIKSIQEAATTLKNEGVTIIIALGHAGYDLDKEICKQIPEVDVVVGGHTNTFLYSGDPPNNPDISEKKEGEYPTLLRNGKCGVVQAYAYGKWMGKLVVKFDNNGDVASFSGNPVLMDDTIQQNQVELDKLAEFDKEIEEFRNEIIGKTDRAIDGERTSCRYGECELGNVVADMYASAYEDVHCSFLGGGSVRSNLNKGNITYEDAHNVLPFGNTIDRFKIKGKYLKEAFEHSVSTFNDKNYNAKDAGSYLQVSGFKVMYDNSQPVGRRVKSLEIAINSNGDMEDVQDEKVYTCATNNYMLSGGDKFDMLTNYTVRDDGNSDVEIFKDYIHKISPVDENDAVKDLPQRSFFTGSAYHIVINYFLLFALFILW